MNLLRFLRPAPYLEENQDQTVVKKEYRYWRIRTFSTIYLGYVLYYFTRKSFVFAMPSMQESLGLSKFELGLICSILSITYGVSKFLSGILGDKSNPRYFMSVGLILTGCFNFFFGASSLFWMFALFWGLNGWFQGWGWPGCAKQLTHWYSQSERGRWWSFLSTSQNIGGALIPLLVAGVVEYNGWRWGLYFPAMLAILTGFWLMFRLRDTPQSLGLPSIEKFRNDYPNGKREPEKVELTVKEILWKYVLSNRYIWVLATLSFLIYVIRTAINDWGMFYLIEMKGYPKIQAAGCVGLFEVGGFCGCITGGWLSDLVFKGKRNPISVLFLLGIMATLCGFRLISFSSPIIASLFFFLFGFFIFGPQNITGLAAAELSHKKAAATATGFTGCFSYLGAATAGGPLGALIKGWGWDSFIMTLGTCSLLGVLLILPLWSLKVNQEAKKDVLEAELENS
ncbi:MAG TPA: MFS transporter [Chlamydiales bacterium]|nr:MFS transporter [Chlamydiales bacterium]